MKKTYIKPSIELNSIALENMLQNSVNGVTGLDGVTMGNSDFGGGAADGKIRGSRTSDDFDELW
jgi:hypothetical protein